MQVHSNKGQRARPVSQRDQERDVGGH